jgi:site-specific recombinase XerD
LQVIGKRPAHSLTADEVKRYILYCINTLQLSENTIHSRLNALKFYYEQVLKREKIFVEIPRPKKPFILPKVLGEQEMSRLFRSLENKKHKALLFTAYSAGLRVSEAVRLRIRDIDPDRMQIFVERAKGKKDRYVMLSPVLLDILRNYMRTCKPRPKEYLFEGEREGEPLSTRTAQEVFQQARQRAGLKKHVSFHSLRHSFATHLLEQGIDIKYIKELLGHFSIHTTNRYLHVKKENLINIRSPLDEIYQREEWGD